MEDALSRLRFRPGCIHDPQLSLDIEIKLWNQGGSIIQAATFIDQDNSTIHKGYFVDLSMRSGMQRKFRGKVFEGSTGTDIVNIEKQNLTRRVLTP